MFAQKLIFKSSAARLALLALLVVGLSSCGAAATGTPGPEAVFTSAAQTAEARSTQMFAQTPTTDPAGMVATLAAPTPTLAPASPTTASPAGQTPAAPPAGATQAASPPAATGGDAALYVADVTVPDGALFAPGEAFEKVWRISNSGTTTWSVAYSLVFIDGNLMGAETRIPLPNEVAPGEEVEISVPMVAPENAGTYTSYWKMTTANGALFGFGAAGNEAIWVKISVGGGATPESGVPTGPAPIVSGAALSLSNAAVTGPCPYTFNLIGQITLTKAATVTYLLEAGTAAGDTVRTPLPITRNLAEGIHPVVYDLTMPNSFAGWARLHITAPVDLASEPVNFSLACG